MARLLTLVVVKHVAAYPGTNRHAMRAHFPAVSWQALYAAIRRAVHIGLVKAYREPGDVVDRLLAAL